MVVVADSHGQRFSSSGRTFDVPNGGRRKLTAIVICLTSKLAIINKIDQKLLNLDIHN